MRDLGDLQLKNPWVEWQGRQPARGRGSPHPMQSLPGVHHTWPPPTRGARGARRGASQGIPVGKAMEAPTIPAVYCRTMGEAPVVE